MLERLGAISPRNQRILLILGCAVLFCVWFVRVPLIEPDETRYTEATREMVASANYIIPHYNFEHRFQKPIFYYWVQSAARIAFGPSEAAARFPSALFAIAMVFLLHGFLMRWLRRWAGKDNEQKQKVAQGTAFLGAISLAILPLIAIWTRVAVTDITLTFFITGALISLLQASLEEKRPTGWYLLAAFFCGMAFLTKGPIGIAIPGLVWLVFHIRQKTILSELRRVPWVLAILILLAINLPWYLSTLYTKDGSGFLRQ
ncbi:MAG TPA: glycosyltransferase family 39 protein, partial [Armatimonadota bacterium]|nr:glycosyltransferase family 39 protein [Armatimonadota bacterium]